MKIGILFISAFILSSCDAANIVRQIPKWLSIFKHKHVEGHPKKPVANNMKEEEALIKDLMKEQERLQELKKQENNIKDLVDTETVLSLFGDKKPQEITIPIVVPQTPATLAGNRISAIFVRSSLGKLIQSMMKFLWLLKTNSQNIFKSAEAASAVENGLRKMLVIMMRALVTLL